MQAEMEAELDEEEDAEEEAYCEDEDDSISPLVAGLQGGATRVAP